MSEEIYDVFIIGGGVNGAAIARDSAGRGLKVALAEKDDLASHTSSKSTNLFHGGLRYLEYFKINLVRQSLKERDILLKNMPHIAWPMRFILPLNNKIKFSNSTPTTKVIKTMMPWFQNRRPDWIIRLGLFLYDNIGGHTSLPTTSKINLHTSLEGALLKNTYKNAYEYSDVWVQDSRLVVLLAQDAHQRGANIMTYNEVLEIHKLADYWQIKTTNGVFKSKTLINTAGQWVNHIIEKIPHITSQARVRLVKGSHIVVPRLCKHDKSYMFQGGDGRIIFALPFERDFTVIGTTDEPHDNANLPAVCSDKEITYLCDFINHYLEKSITPNDVIWTYSGVRPLYDDNSPSNTEATREYVLTIESDGYPLLNVFGGKITTHRKLAEDALEKLGFKNKWTHNAALAGGDFKLEERNHLLATFKKDFPDLESQNCERIFNAYGTKCWEILKKNKGEYFGGGLYACEVDYLIQSEFALFSEDILWRRSKLGLFFTKEQVLSLKKYIGEKT